MEKIHEHLSGRPIAPIFAKSMEKDNVIAMKLMCVIDYLLEKRGLNAEIDAVPKLREQLLQLKSYASFRFYNYSAPYHWFRDEILQCKICEFVGPYLLTHVHMSVTHDFHVGVKQCLWCNYKTEFEKHILDGSAHECYDIYLTKEQLHEVNVPKVVMSFYDMLKVIATALDVKSERTHAFAGLGYKQNELIEQSDSDDELDRRIVVYKKRNYQKYINSHQLDRLFRIAMQYFYRDEVSQICASLNKNEHVEQNDIIEPKRRRVAGNSSKQNISFGIGQVEGRTQAFAQFIAFEVDTIQDEDVKQQTKRIIQDAIYNGQLEDKTKKQNQKTENENEEN